MPLPLIHSTIHQCLKTTLSTHLHVYLHVHVYVHVPLLPFCHPPPASLHLQDTPLPPPSTAYITSQSTQYNAPSFQTPPACNKTITFPCTTD